MFKLFYQQTTKATRRKQMGGMYNTMVHLNDVENRDIAVVVVFVSWSGHHHILWLQESPHYIQYCRLTHTSRL